MASSYHDFSKRCCWSQRSRNFGISAAVDIRALRRNMVTMDRQRRNLILLWIIVLGLANFVFYTFIYWYLGGDAPNGFVDQGRYHLRGHFLWALAGRASEPVPRYVWLYSYIHSITIWPTIAAVLIPMFILARPHIIATMKTDAPVRGHIFVAVCITVIALVTAASTMIFVFDFAKALSTVAQGGSYNV